MALASAQLIDAIAALLRGVSGWADSVHTSRLWPLAEADLPAWRVQAEDETVDAHGIGFPAKQQHELEVACHGYARATSDLDDVLHGLAEQALGALFASRDTATLVPARAVMTLARIERDLVTEGEAALGRITLALRVRFFTLNNDPSTVA